MESINCAICGEDNAVFLFSKWGHNIVRCRQCGLSYVNPRNFKVESDDYFGGPYLSMVEENGILKSGIEYIYSEVVGNLNTYLVPGHLLDVGCAMGHFMAFARGHGWNVHGVECSRHAADYGSKRWGLRIQPVCDLREAGLPDNHFDACVLIEVAGHLPHPRTTLTEVLRSLKPGGMVYITTPNFSSFRSLLQREEWQAVIPTGHLYYFAADSLEKLLNSVGFIQIKNLTLPARLESEMDLVSGNGTLRIGPTDLGEIRRQAAVEDATKLSNARGEGLVMCAVKPRSEHDVVVASLRWAGPMPVLDDKLVSAPGDRAEDKKVYLVHEGRKHWVTTVDWLHKHGRRLEETIQVDRELLDSILPGPLLGNPTSVPLFNSTFSTRDKLLSSVGETLSGSGVEFGAGASPFPVGKRCKVLYADRNTNDELQQRGYFGQSELVKPDLISDFVTMQGLVAESVDFIIGSHVIEHTSNPIQALRSAFDRLVPGGQLVLTIPDKNVTFDRDRPLTSLEHLLADYTRPSRERDWEHYIEFFSKSFPQPDPVQTAKRPFELAHDIHFHVWTYESFGDLVKYVREELDPWSSVWSHPRISAQDIEFYFILTK